MAKQGKMAIDQDGVIYDCVEDFLVKYGIPHGGTVYFQLKRGLFKRGNLTLRYLTPSEIPQKPVEIFEPVEGLTNTELIHGDPLWEKLSQRYTRKEIEQIANGQGIDKRRITFPEIHLEGRHHKMVVISDTHIGSVYSPEIWHDMVADYVNTHDIDCVLHCGDLVDGLKIGRTGTQIYELSDIGFEAQKDKAVEMMKKYNVPIYIISGNHDAYFQEFAGANIVKAVADEVPNMTYIGHNSADITVDNCTIRLFHGTDGSSYALSYRLQKIVEGINGGHKPNILLAGHVHKMCYICARNIHAISVPCLQKQTKFMEGKKLEAHTGFLELEFDANNSGVCNLSVKYFPFYA